MSAVVSSAASIRGLEQFLLEHDTESIRYLLSVLAELVGLVSVTLNIKPDRLLPTPHINSTISSISTTAEPQ